MTDLRKGPRHDVACWYCGAFVNPPERVHWWCLRLAEESPKKKVQPKKTAQPHVEGN